MDAKTVVRLRHFTFCSKHVALLMQLQIETPSLPLQTDGALKPVVLVIDLNLDHEKLLFLNPQAA